MTELQVRQEEGGKVLIRGGERRGAWSRPVVDSRGVFYLSLAEAAKSNNVDNRYIRLCIEEEKTIGDKLFAWATRTEVDSYIASVESHKKKQQKDLQEYADKMLNKLSSDARKTLMNVEAAPIQPKNPFVGVEWPDQTVTLRLSTGGTWNMTRPSRAEVPDEIRNCCSWVKL